MAKTKISEFSTTPGNNTDINGINIAEGCAPSGINNAIRELMSDLKEWQSGAMDVYVIPQGTAAAPGIQLYGDLDTGLYGYAANQLGVAVGGASAGYFSSAGWVGNVNGTITGDINATTIDTTNLEVTNIKAKDGTAAITIADSTGVVSVSTQLAVDNLNLSGNTLSSSDTNGNIILAPNGTGDVYLDADTIRVGDSNTNVTITSNGTADLTLNTNGGTNSGAITIEDGVNGNINVVPNGTGGVYLDNTAGTSLFVRNTTSSASGSSFVAFQNKDGAGNYRTVARASGLTTSNGGNGSFVVETAFSNVLYKGLLINSESDVFFYDSNGNQALKWDSTDKYLGINQTSPTAALDVVGDVKVSGTVNATTIDLTNIEVTNIKAKDGSASATIADSTGVMTIASSVLTTTDINGGTIDGTTIGGSTAAAGTFTTATATTGNITTVNATTVDTTNIEVTNIKAKDGTAALSIADSTGAVTVATALTANGGAVFNENGADVDFRVEGDTDANLIFADASTDRVGIGTSSPAYKLTVYNNINGTPVSWGNATRSGYLYQDASGVGITDGANTAFTNGLYINTASNYTALYTNANERLRLDTSGNLGLGVTPSGWGASWKALELPNGVAIASAFGIDYQTVNAYHNGTNFIYKTSSVASYYQNGPGAHAWYTAPSGTAGNTISFTQAMTLDASGNLLIGNTGGTQRLTVSAANPTNGYVASIANSQGTTGRTGTYLLFDATSLAAWKIGIPPDVNAFSFYDVLAGTERARIDSSGNLLIGTTTLAYSAAGRGLVELNGSSSSLIALKTGDTARGYFAASSTITELAAVGASQPLLFTANGSERARITSGGYFKASNAGTYQNSTGDFHELRSSTSGNVTADIRHTNNTNPYGIIIGFTAATPNGTGNYFLNCLDSTAQRAEIRSNGGLANYQSNNVDLSDIRTKTDISPLASYWNKIAALEIVTYKYKDQTHDDLNIGVIAQQVEQVAPEFVDPDGFGETPEDGVPLKTIYNKDLTFAAIKALQEAMARIEKLEAEVAALKGA